MLKIFGGMIIGSMMTMMLLGGSSAVNRPDAITTVLLLVIVSIFLGTLTMWPAKPVMETEKVIKKLRRHCK
jgi:hypothetical protein